jgi:hypothetical protein
LNAALALATAIGTIIIGPLVHQWGYGTIPVMALLGLVISLLLAIDKRASSGGPRVDPSMIVEQDRGHMEEISKETK